MSEFSSTVVPDLQKFTYDYFIFMIAWKRYTSRESILQILNFGFFPA